MTEQVKRITVRGIELHHRNGRWEFISEGHGYEPDIWVGAESTFGSGCDELLNHCYELQKDRDSCARARLHYAGEVGRVLGLNSVLVEGVTERDDLLREWVVMMSGAGFGLEEMKALRDKTEGLLSSAAPVESERVPMHEAVQHAAGYLPPGWMIDICVERAGGGVELYDPQGLLINFPTNNERLDYTINDALQHALEVANGCDKGVNRG